MFWVSEVSRKGGESDSKAILSLFFFCKTRTAASTAAKAEMKLFYRQLFYDPCPPWGQPSVPGIFTVPLDEVSSV